MKKQLFALLAMLVIVFGPVQLPVAAQNYQSRQAGEYQADVFSRWSDGITAGHAAGTSITITVANATVTLPDGRTITPFTTTNPLTLTNGTSETVTPSAVSGCYSGAQYGTCTITVTTTYDHGAGPSGIVSGSAGLQEAINEAHVRGGLVALAGDWGGTNTMITAATPYNNVSVVDKRLGGPRYWNPTPTGLALAAPSGVPVTGQAACDGTHQSCSDATVGGSASWGGTVFVAVTYMDCFGNEGPASATTSWTSVASKAIDIATPVTGSTGACGWVPYLSLSAGTYILAYQIPPTATVCTLSTLTPIPSCSLSSTYGVNALFTGGAQITTYPVNTAMTYPTLATTAATLAGQHPMTNSSLTYKYAPSGRAGNCGWTSSNMVQNAAAGGINGSSATTVPNPIASWSIPAACFNYIGAEFRVSGKWTYTDGGDSSTRIIVAWDSNGTNTASVPTPLCNMLDTATGTGAAYNGTYNCTVRVLTTGATGTAIVNGYSTQNLAAGATTLVRNSADVAVAASGSINLASNARIVVWFEGIGATNNPGAQSLAATLEAVN